ncbi:MAG: hypothetical protein DRI26_05775 [Chloroflexi bacterium]|nr:MAG: hypothetical protein DRI26_05775 [Chloroflexota bacterium]
MLKTVRSVFERIGLWLDKWIPRIADFLLITVLIVLFLMSLAVFIIFFQFLYTVYLGVWWLMKCGF